MPDSEDSVSEFAGWPQAGEVVEMFAVPDSEGMVFEFAVWPQCGLPEVVDAFPEPDSKSLASGSLVLHKDPALFSPDGLFKIDPAWIKYVRQALCRMLVGSCGATADTSGSCA